MPTKILKALVTTTIKQSTIDGSQITDQNLKFTLLAGSKLEINSNELAANNHWELELTSPVNGVRKWFAYIPHVNIIDMYSHEQTLVTYYIFSDENDKLKTTAKLACNFWNRFIRPQFNTVIRLGTFYSPGFTIARAFRPWKNNNSVYGRIEFNTKYLGQYTAEEIAGTIIHEIGHTLGFGWDEWMNLFYTDTGIFKTEYIEKIPELQYMLVETDYGPATQYSHWDEERFDKELMTGFKDKFEYVLPVTIKVMQLLGNTIIENLTEKTDLEKIIEELGGVMFAMEEEIQNINLAYFEETEISEEVYTRV